MRRGLATAALALLLTAACGGGDDANDVPDACAGDTGCGGECAAGNSFGVGRYCTAGGGECAGQAATFCTVDFNPTDLAFCTRPCDPSADVVEQCGEDAACADDGGSGPSGCVPLDCT